MPAQLASQADCLLRIRPVSTKEAEGFPEGKAVIAFLVPLRQPEMAQILARRRMTSFSLDAIPRISRAQSMDTLSSMATVAGYRAVLLAAQHLPKFLPMLTTAAGTIRPAQGLILGAGVAGLQAIATARRLGAVVEAFDVRPAVKEQVKAWARHSLKFPRRRTWKTRGDTRARFRRKRWPASKSSCMNAPKWPISLLPPLKFLANRPRA